MFLLDNDPVSNIRVCVVGIGCVVVLIRSVQYGAVPQLAGNQIENAGALNKLANDKKHYRTRVSTGILECR